jgi:PAS domain S-box-containing protein
MLHVAVVLAFALFALAAAALVRANRRVRASEQRYRQLVDALPNTIVATFDQDLRYTFVGGIGLAATGWSEHEYLGRTPMEQLSSAEAAAFLQEHYRAVFDGESRELEYTSVRNRRPYWLGIVPLRDGAGEVEGGMVVMHDVSGQRETETRLRESEERLRTVVSALEEGIVVHAPDGSAVMSNESAHRLLGLGAVHPGLEAASWKLIREDNTVLTPDEYPASRALSTGEPQLGEVAGLCLPGGTVRWLSINAVPLIRDGEPEPYSVVVSFTDISARKEAERVKDEFFALVSHELRTPLTSIAGYVELLREEDEPLTDDQRHLVGVVHRNTRRLQRLVGDLLFVAQLEAGRLEFDHVDVELGAVVEESIEYAQRAAAARGVELTVDIDPAGVAGDAARLGQLVDNLLSNAIKFTPASGAVAVELTNAGGEASLVVRDTGIGIPAGELDRLFVKFFRASTVLDQKIPGVGLGLAICKSIVEGHGGTIAIDSSEGGGTTVTVTLPATATVLAA